MSLKLFHTADLHLARSEQAYSLAVLEELAYHCRRLGAAAWLFSGDVFDSHADALALAAEFRAFLGGLEDVPVLMIPGNHELSGGRSLADLAPLADGAGAGGPLQVALEEPFALYRPEGLELEVLALPFRRSFEGYPDWPVPPAERRWRVGLLHGVVNGMTYTGDSEEDEHAVIDPDLFRRLGLHYAALGHIHARREQRFGETLAHYPGSPRVWRRGEAGVRQASLVHLDDGGVRVEPVPVQAAGVFRRIPVLLDADGGLLEHESPDALLAELDATCGPEDWVCLELSGFLESREPAKRLASALDQRGSRQHRRFEVRLEQVQEAEQLRGHPLVGAFEAHWRRRHAEAREAGDEQELALLQRARRLALEQILQWLPED